MRESSKNIKGIIRGIFICHFQWQILELLKTISDNKKTVALKKLMTAEGEKYTQVKETIL